MTTINSKLTFQVIIMLILMIGIASCDKSHDKEYNVENQMGFDIEVIFDTPTSTDTIIIDSILTKQIYSYYYFFGTVGVDDDRYEDPIDNISVRALDTAISIPESRWIYEQKSKYYAKYLMVIDSSDFVF